MRRSRRRLSFDRAPDANEDDVIAHVRSRVASYKKPTRVYFVESLPRNASMKVLKAQLIARFSGPANPSSAARDNTIS